MMLYPSITTLSESVPNRYLLVNVVARRARQLSDLAKREHFHLAEKPVTSAINEVAAGKIRADGVDISIQK